MAERAPGAVLQAFFPGEEGGPALASVLSGGTNPSGRLPVSLPRSAGSQPFSYLHPILGGPNEITSASSAPTRPFGFGLSYTSFEHSELQVEPEAPAGGSFRASVRVRNTGDRAGTDVVQLYARDVYASVTRPVAQLVGYLRVALDSGAEETIEFDVPTTRLAFTGLDRRAHRRARHDRAVGRGLVRRQGDDRRHRTDRRRRTSSRPRTRRVTTRERAIGGVGIG